MSDSEKQFVSDIEAYKISEQGGWARAIDADRLPRPCGERPRQRLYTRIWEDKEGGVSSAPLLCHVLCMPLRTNVVPALRTCTPLSPPAHQGRCRHLA